MNTRTIYWEDCLNPSEAGPRGPASTRVSNLYPVTRAVVAFTAGLTLLVGSIWAITDPGFAMYVQAFTWSLSFAFFAVSIESVKSTTSLLALVTGIAIQLIAVLSAHVGAELTILSTLLVSAWLGIAIYKR